MYQYSYLLGDVALLAVWFILFLWRKDVRKEMLLMSFIVGVAGLLVEPIYTEDWWRPLTITNTRVGIEDFLFGFVVGGVAAVIYEEVFKRKVKPRMHPRHPLKHLLQYFVFLLAAFATLLVGSFSLLGLNSFYASLVAFIPPILFIWTKRPDLIADSFFTGVLGTMVGFIWFWVPELITPGWVNAHWYLENLSGIVILKAPLEDLIWGFLAGAFIGPLYEFCQEARLIAIKRTHK